MSSHGPRVSNEKMADVEALFTDTDSSHDQLTLDLIHDLRDARRERDEAQPEYSQEQLNEALSALTSFPGAGSNWPDLFAALDTVGSDYVECKVSDRHDEDNILGLVVVARGDRAVRLRRVLEQLDDEETE